MNPVADQKERQAALDPARSFIVQAPAGSGKTELLIQRYLKLLSRVSYPEEILCMTFTRKAAGEMRNRILKALVLGQNETPPEKAHERATWELAREALAQNQAREWHLLEYPARLKVQTIDSFCTWLVRHMPIRSRLGGQMEPDEYAIGAYMEAARRLLHRVESRDSTSESARKILRHLDNNKGVFIKRILQILEKRDQWLIPFFQNNRVDDNLKECLESYLAEIIESVLMEAKNLFPDSIKDDLVHLAAFAGSNLADASENGSHPLAGLHRFPGARVGHIEQWQALADLFLNKDGNYRKKLTKNEGFPPDGKEAKQLKQQFLDILSSLSGNRDLESKLAEIRQLPLPFYTEHEWEILKASFDLFQPLDEILRQVFREQEMTDFTEISLSAIKSLGEQDRDDNLLPTDLALYLDYKLQHILVDEFQDTSFKQHELLKRLTAGWVPGDGRTLFIVGDPMQSIFRFRDADVGLFLKTRKDGVGDLQLDQLTLKTNFRSQPKVVDWVNRCFQTVFPKQENPDLGEIQFSPSTAFNPEEDLPGVELHPLEIKDDKLEAVQVAELAQNILDQNPDKTVAILVRARRHLVEIVQELRKCKMDYKAQDIDPLTQRPEILDLLSLMKALRSPLDRIAWLSILRAPWCGLTLNDLHALCLHEGKRSVWDLLQDETVLERLDLEARNRAHQFCETLKPALAALPRSNFRDLLEGLWIALGGPACIPEGAMQDVEVFFEEVGRAVETGSLARLDRFEQELENLYASPSPKESRLHILTMHKAKGLEFDFVILPGLGRQAKTEENRLVLWLPHGDSILLAPLEETGMDQSKLYTFIKDLNSRKDQFEALRLLYVASTRAKIQLHLFGHVKKKEDQFKPESKSPLEMLWPFLEKDWIAHSKPSQPEEANTEPVTYPARLKRLPIAHSLPEPPAPLATGKSFVLKEPEVTTYDWAQYAARCIGTVVHRCLQEFSRTGPIANEPDWPLWKKRLERSLGAMGLAGNVLENACQTGLDSLRNTLDDPTGRWILADHEEAASEWALTILEQDEVQQRILDRTFVDDGTRWIIDYKTGLHSGTDLDTFLENEGRRYAPQLNTYETILRQMGETRPIKKALYFPLHQKLVLI